MARSPWLTSEQAARRLRVKPETLYAYVSRGLIRSERVPGQRRSRFSRADVERHAARSRVGGRAGGLEVVIETQLTLLDPAGRLHYRGWNVADAVDTSTFEAVASWLWAGELEPAPFTAPAELAHAAATVIDHLRLLPPVDQWRSAIGPIRLADPFRADRRPVAVSGIGRALIATLVESVPVLGRDPGPNAPVAARLWPRLTAQRPSRSRLAALNAALVMLADHELAASTLAARVAASTWADPYLCVQAGLAVLGGPLHGGSSEEARQLIRETDIEGGSAADVIGRRLAQGARIPGFGHRIYETSDPRAALLLGKLDHPSGTRRSVGELIDVMKARQLPFPNVDFAMAAMAETYAMVDGATELIFATARIVGWLAHAIEEYEHALRFRTRAAYVGPAPGAVAS